MFKALLFGAKKAILTASMAFVLVVGGFFITQSAQAQSGSSATIEQSCRSGSGLAGGSSRFAAAWQQKLVWVFRVKQSRRHWRDVNFPSSSPRIQLRARYRWLQLAELKRSFQRLEGVVEY